MTILRCAGWSCGRSISPSRPGWVNPAALRWPETYAIDYGICPECKADFCVGCIATRWRFGSTSHCQSCRGTLVPGAGTDVEEVRRLPWPEAVLRHNEGVGLLRSGQHAAALNAFDRAVALRPEYPSAHLQRAAALGALGRRGAAVDALDTVLRIDPGHAEALLAKAAHLVALDRLAEAVLTYDRCIALAPRHVPAYVDKSIELGNLGLPEDALHAADLAVHIAKAGTTPRHQHAAAHSARAMALVRLSRPGDALEAVDQAIGIGPDIASDHYIRSLALDRLGRTEEARLAYRLYTEKKNATS